MSTLGAGTLSPKKKRPTKTGKTRNRLTSDEYAALDAQIYCALAADYPQCVRNVFYQMSSPRLPVVTPKTEAGAKMIGRRLVNLRRAGKVPYGWVTDATRRGYHTNTYADGADFLRRVKGLYRADLWKDAGCHCEVWVESRSIAGVVQDDCEELAVSLYPAGGFTSLSLPYQAAEFLNSQHAVDPRPITIFYIGDYDPAGVLIDRKIESELRQHLHAEIDLNFQRIGITREQVEEFDLPTKPRKIGDKRSPEVAFTVEAEAMPAGQLRQLLRDHIEALLPPHALKIAKVAEGEAFSLIDRLVNVAESEAAW